MCTEEQREKEEWGLLPVQMVELVWNQIFVEHHGKLCGVPANGRNAEANDSGLNHAKTRHKLLYHIAQSERHISSGSPGKRSATPLAAVSHPFSPEHGPQHHTRPCRPVPQDRHHRANRRRGCVAALASALTSDGSGPRVPQP